MELTILGSGTCVPSLERGGPANLLKIGGKNIVIDLGPGTLNKLFKAGISYKDIDIVLLTHFHSDHVSELNSFIQALNWTPKYTRKKDLVIIGPVGLKKLIKQGVFNIHSLPNTYKIKIKEIKHKIVEKILYYSELDKACGTYAIGLQKHIVDGLVHTSYNPVRTGTTRLSSDEPNLQNLPKFGALNIRNAFIPRKDHYFINQIIVR